MLDRVHLDGFWPHERNLSGRIDAASLRALQRLPTHAAGYLAEEVERNLCQLFDHARFNPAVLVFVTLTPNTLAEAREVAIHHFRTAWPEVDAGQIAEQVQLRLQLTPEPVFDAWLSETPPAWDDETAHAP